MTKTKAAFLLTAERLFTPGEKVYFWTFTFAVVQSDWDAAHYFSRFLNHLRKTLGGDWGGVRVVELHREHGVHYHALINRRLGIDIVRRVARCYAIGRISVQRADNGSCTYLAKYLSKQRSGPKTQSGRNARRWAKFGPVHHTRISDLINDSPYWNYRRAHHYPWLSYHQENFLARAWDHGEDVFRAAYFAAKEERTADVQGLIHHRLRIDHIGCLTERFPSELLTPTPQICPF